jgi:hypothetical protein
MASNRPLQLTNAPRIIYLSEFLVVRSQLNARVVRPRPNITNEVMRWGTTREEVCCGRIVLSRVDTVRKDRMRVAARDQAVKVLRLRKIGIARACAGPLARRSRATK